MSGKSAKSAMASIALSALAIAGIASICHEANAAYCRSIGDDSQKSWDDAPEWQRNSAIKGVEFHLANPDAGDAASHESWLKEKQAAGWVFGEVKDEEKKTHPCIVPFDQLPPAQQFKDALFRSIVHAAAPLAYALEPDNEDEPSDEQKALMAAAFERLGITIENVERGDAPVFIASLNGAADRLEAAESENAKLKADAEKADKAAKAAKAKPAASAPKIRKVAPPKGEHVALAPGDLLELIGAADEVVIVFSDGRQEIAGVPALEVSGDAWKVTGAGLALSGVDVLIHGPAHGQGTYAIHGYGLLLDGEQVAYAPAADVRQVGPNAQVRLSDDIVF